MPTGECINLAAVDIGTNSFHLIVAKADCEGNFEIIDREKEVVRLGQGHEGDIKKLSRESIDRSIAVLKRFKGIADSHNAKMRAIATSAVREASNKNEFVGRALDEAGIEVEVISGTEEARIIYEGILQAVPVYDRKCLCIDIGGGSTEFVMGIRGEIDYSMSLKLGAVRLTQRFFSDYNLSKNSIAECREWVDGEIYHVASKSLQYNPEICVGSSGTILTCAYLSAVNKGERTENILLNNYELTAGDIFEIEETILRKKTLAERKKMSGLDDKRAEIIPAGIIILASVVRKFRIDKITVSDYALREGILIDTIYNYLNLSGPLSISDIRRESVRKLSNSCNFDSGHCDHVARLSLRLYDQLEPLHKLEPVCREYLECAAKLHDIGYHISHSQHHIHSDYIIRNSELLGFNQNEIDIIANVARYHRKSHPKKRHKHYVNLSGKGRDIVDKLSAILRIADSLDRTHSRGITDIKISEEKSTVHLEIYYKGDFPEIELWNLNRRKSLFEEVFGRKIGVRTYQLY